MILKKRLDFNTFFISYDFSQIWEAILGVWRLNFRNYPDEVPSTFDIAELNLRLARSMESKSDSFP